jgi:putative Ca2+/H+ antiporter (TMEM165/GDT1 family)
MESFFHEFRNLNFLSTDLLHWLSVSASSFALIFAAEFGDKSQLVCMTLAFKHRAMPVFLGAVAAFILLNGLAVVFGAAIASWIPDYIIASIVMLLFAGFGFNALLTQDEEEDDSPTPMKIHNMFFATFILIIFAEFGDKTQLAVVALSSTALPLAVWTGSTIALASTSAIGVFAGRKILQKISFRLLHRLSGIFFIVLAAFAGYTAYLKIPDQLISNLKNEIVHLIN